MRVDANLVLLTNVFFSVMLTTQACASLDADMVVDKNTDQDSETSSDSDTDTGLDTDTNTEMNTDSETASDTTCDEQTLLINYVDPHVMLLLDMSGSMILMPERWAAATAALDFILDQYADEILFGFDIFPDSGGWDSCQVENLVVADCGAGNETLIQGWLSTNEPHQDSATPLYCEMANFADNPAYAPAFQAAAGAAYLVVISDGSDTCGIYCDPAWADFWETVNGLKDTTIQLLSQGIKTMAIGLGSGTSPTELNAIAQNGGTEFSVYLDSQSEAELQSALDTVVSAAKSCIYELDEPSDAADPNKVNFYFDDDVVAQDDDCSSGEGWMWHDDSHTAVEFCEQTCELLGQVENVTAKFGCPTVIIE